MGFCYLLEFQTVTVLDFGRLASMKKADVTSSPYWYTALGKLPLPTGEEGNYIL